MKTTKPYYIVFGLLMMAGGLAVSIIDPQAAADFLSSTSNWLMILLAVFLVMVFAAVLSAMDALKMLVAKREGRLVEVLETEEAMASEKSWLSNLWARLQDSKPIEQEEEIDLDHEYDGIRELDNNLPPWWLYGFYATIIFAVIYLVRFHITDSAPLQYEEYEQEMVAAAEAREEYLKQAANLVDENNVTAVNAEPRIANGKAIFNKNCAVCHMKDGGGGVGPNLTDPYWIHGGGIEDVFETIKYGVPAKGMISWQDQLSPSDMQDVSSYVLTLSGTTPANPKEPQGELYEPAPEEAGETEEAPQAEETSATSESAEL